MVVTDPLPSAPASRPALADAAQGQERKNMADGTEGNDTLVISRSEVNETINAVGGDDIIHAFIGPAVQSTITVNAGSGNDSINVANGSSYTVVVNGGEGWDNIHAHAEPDAPYVTSVSAIQITLAGAPVEGVFAKRAIIAYSQVEYLNIGGTAWTADGSRAVWTTGNTMDEIRVKGSAGGIPVTVSTGGGNDTVHLIGAVGNGSRAEGGSGDDKLFGSPGADTLDGGEDFDSLYGGDGDDSLHGGAASDLLLGDGGTDTLDGGDGNDVLIGGGGRDILIGGAGSDIFRYSSAGESSGAGGIDTIGFERGVDKIDLSAITSVKWIGGAAFGGNAGEVRATIMGIQVDINGDKNVDMIIWVSGHYGGTMLGPADFVV